MSLPDSPPYMAGVTSAISACPAPLLLQSNPQSPFSPRPENSAASHLPPSTTVDLRSAVRQTWCSRASSHLDGQARRRSGSTIPAITMTAASALTIKVQRRIGVSGAVTLIVCVPSGQRNQMKWSLASRN